MCVESRFWPENQWFSCPAAAAAAPPSLPAWANPRGTEGKALARDGGGGRARSAPAGPDRRGTMGHGTVLFSFAVLHTLGRGFDFRFWFCFDSGGSPFPTASNFRECLLRGMVVAMVPRGTVRRAASSISMIRQSVVASPKGTCMTTIARFQRLLPSWCTSVSGIDLRRQPAASR